MNISAKITGIEYKIFLVNELEIIDLQTFDINTCPSSCVVSSGNSRFALSKWVTPKRTRTYPYERVYNTLSASKKITIISVVKDEGAGGYRDFIKWDTVSLMSLLDVYVILAYYSTADKHKKKSNKLTNQKYDNDFIISKINEIENYHSSALHWNLKEISDNLPNLIEQVSKNYTCISEKLSVKLHALDGLISFKTKILSEANAFMEFSREKAENAQSREIQRTQPKEFLKTLTEAKITITNYLGGKYFFTVDEVLIYDKNIQLIESKNSKSTKLPAVSDVKDGLLKMILYSNLKEIWVEGSLFTCTPKLHLTSSKLIGSVNSSENSERIYDFCAINLLSKKQNIFISQLFAEAKHNNFIVIISNSKL